METIREFKGDYDFLSNFYACAIYDPELNMWAPTAEHLYQARKCTDTEQARTIMNAITPGKAKRMGKEVDIVSYWEGAKLLIMEEILRVKFSEKHPSLQTLLADTGTRTLEEGNWWGDAYWGIDLKTGKGENHLGLILMKIRKELL